MLYLLAFIGMCLHVLHRKRRKQWFESSNSCFCVTKNTDFVDIFAGFLRFWQNGSSNNILIFGWIRFLCSLGACALVAVVVLIVQLCMTFLQFCFSVSVGFLALAGVIVSLRRAGFRVLCYMWSEHQSYDITMREYEHALTSDRKFSWLFESRRSGLCWAFFCSANKGTKTPIVFACWPDTVRSIPFAY